MAFQWLAQWPCSRARLFASRRICGGKALLMRPSGPSASEKSAHWPSSLRSDSVPAAPNQCAAARLGSSGGGWRSRSNTPVSNPRMVRRISQRSLSKKERRLHGVLHRRADAERRRPASFLHIVDQTGSLPATNGDTRAAGITTVPPPTNSGAHTSAGSRTSNSADVGSRSSRRADVARRPSRNTHAVPCWRRKSAARRAVFTASCEWRDNSTATTPR